MIVITEDRASVERALDVITQLRQHTFKPRALMEDTPWVKTAWARPEYL
jgi:hypothetical protein